MNHSLSTLFGTLHEGGVKYFLMTDFESELKSGDIDLFVAPESRAAFEEALRTSGWYKRKEPSYHLNHHFYYTPKSELYLDVKYALSFACGPAKCYTYHHAVQAQSRAVLNTKGLYRPSGIDAILLYAAHLAFMERGKLAEKHRVYLRHYINRYKAEVQEEYSATLAGLQQWLDTGFPHDTAHLQALLHPFFIQQHTKMTRDTRYKRFGYGLKVLFLGTDGAGKSTLIEAVENKLNLKTNKLYLGMGENGWTSPLVKSIFHMKLKPQVLDKAFSFFKAFVVLPAELLLRQVPVKLRSKYSVVLIDRVPGAYLLDKALGKRYLYKSILPKPDVVFFLYASPEVLVKRKPDENTLERSQADIEKFKEVAHQVSEGKYIGIDTSNISIGEAADAIIAEIYKSRKVYDNLLTAQFN